MTNILDDVTAAWLNREDQVLEKSGEPTWKRLADAMERIGQVGTAEDIRNQKCCDRIGIPRDSVHGGKYYLLLGIIQ